MRLLKLELKRNLKTKRNLVLLMLALLLSFLMAYLPTTFSSHSYLDADARLVTLTGLASIRYEKQKQAVIAGSVTPEKIAQAVTEYQNCLAKYGVESSYDLPEGVYGTELLACAPLIHGVKEAFADPDTGIAPNLLELDPAQMDYFYETCALRLSSLMKQEQKQHPAAQKTAAALYEKVTTPYLFFPGYSTDAMDYQILLAFLVLLFVTMIAAPAFTSDYQTHADDILRCTKNGMAKLAIAKLLSALLIGGAAFWLCALCYLVTSDSLFGWETTKTSVQMLYSVIGLLSMNLGQLQLFVAFSGLLSILAAVSFTLFLSARCKTIVTSVSASLAFCILPIIVYMALPSEIGNWIYPLLPAGGVGLQTSILYAAIDFDFWNIGGLAIWLPFVMLGAYVIEIPLFFLLAIRAYRKHPAD